MLRTGRYKACLLMNLPGTDVLPGIFLSWAELIEIERAV
jgi:hypothetical protein